MMTDNKNRILNENEEPIIDAIISQRAEIIDGDVLVYSELKTQKELHKKGIWAKNKIDPFKQFTIINNLAEDGIIDANYLVNVSFINTYRSLFAPERPQIESEFEHVWMRQTDWTFSHVQCNGKYTTDDIYEKYGSSLFINMSIDDINAIEDKYKASHAVYARINPDRLSIDIRFDKEKKWHVAATFKDDKAQFLIARYALSKRAGDYVDRAEIYKKLDIDVRKKSLVSQVYGDNPRMKKLIPILIELDSDEILIRKSKKITLSQMNELKKELKIA